jgi:hypothetical protein
MRVGFVLFHYCSFDPSARELQRSELAFNRPGISDREKSGNASRRGKAPLKPALDLDDAAIISEVIGPDNPKSPKKMVA